MFAITHSYVLSYSVDGVNVLCAFIVSVHKSIGGWAWTSCV